MSRTDISARLPWNLTKVGFKDRTFKPEKLLLVLRRSHFSVHAAAFRVTHPLTTITSKTIPVTENIGAVMQKFIKLLITSDA